MNLAKRIKVLVEGIQNNKFVINIIIKKADVNI